MNFNEKDINILLINNNRGRGERSLVDVVKNPPEVRITSSDEDGLGSLMINAMWEPSSRFMIRFSEVSYRFALPFY